MGNVIDFVKEVCYKTVTQLMNTVNYVVHSSLGLMLVGAITFLVSIFTAFKSSNKPGRKKLAGFIGIMYAICGFIAAIAYKEAMKNIKYENERMKGWDDLE